MKLTRNDFSGTSKVCGFTLKQLVVNKANIISIAVTALIILVSFPAVSLLGTGSVGNAGIIHEMSAGSASAVYLCDMTGYGVDKYAAEYFPGSEVVVCPDGAHGPLGDGEVFIRVSPDEESGGYRIYAEGGDCGLKQDTARDVGNLLGLLIRGSVGEKADSVFAFCTAESFCLSDYGGRADEYDFSMDNYFLQLLYTIIVMVIGIYATSYIVQAVVQEKASKLVETLMISVKPLALILGKILAVMIFVFGMIAVYAAAGFTGNMIASAVSGTGTDGGFFASLGVYLPEIRLDAVTIVSAVISTLLGYMTFSLIAGMTGAGCSEQEDIQSANSTSMAIIMVCYIAALAFSVIESPVLKTVISVVPFLSVFCAPVQFMLGEIGLPVLAVSWIVQCAVIALLAVMCAKIYEDLIIYKGRRLGFGSMIKMAFSGKNAAGKERESR